MSNARVQFTSWQLLTTITLICVTLALLTVEPQAGIFVTAMLVGLGLLGFGALRHRRAPFWAGIYLATIGIGLLVFHGATVAACVGRAKLPVHVLVINTDTFEPVEGATLEVLDEPWSPLEGIVSARLLPQFKPATMQSGFGALVTNARGESDFDHEFFASWTEGLFQKPSGYIRTCDFWLKASASGHGSVMVPMDGQSQHGRNFSDRSPLFVTVPLRPNAGGSASP